jgi:trigger factor
MQITIEDLSPVEKRVEFELPWADVVPKLEKAYDSLRRGRSCRASAGQGAPGADREDVQAPGRGRGRPRLCRALDRAGDPREPDPAVAPPSVEALEIKSGAPFKFTARVEVRSQVTPKDYSGVPLSRRPAKVTDERSPRRWRATAAA